MIGNISVPNFHKLARAGNRGTKLTHEGLQCALRSNELRIKRENSVRKRQPCTPKDQRVAEHPTLVRNSRRNKGTESVTQKHIDTRLRSSREHLPTKKVRAAASDRNSRSIPLPWHRAMAGQKIMEIFHGGSRLLSTTKFIESHR